jgi:hypothetical protein
VGKSSTCRCRVKTNRLTLLKEEPALKQGGGKGAKGFKEGKKKKGIKERERCWERNGSARQD